MQGLLVDQRTGETPRKRGALLVPGWELVPSQREAALVHAARVEEEDEASAEPAAHESEDLQEEEDTQPPLALLQPTEPAAPTPPRSIASRPASLRPRTTALPLPLPSLASSSRTTAPFRAVSNIPLGAAAAKPSLKRAFGSSVAEESAPAAGAGVSKGKSTTTASGIVPPRAKRTKH